MERDEQVELSAAGFAVRSWLLQQKFDDDTTVFRTTSDRIGVYE